MVKKGMIDRIEEAWGSKTVIKYKVPEKGKALLREILMPYEEFFPRSIPHRSFLFESKSKKQVVLNRTI
jgi:hypothetical protein